MIEDRLAAGRDSGWWALLVPILLLFLLWSSQAPAATVYGQGSGLPNLSVPSLARDAEGFLWVGTEDGLFRFDGHRFEPLSLEVPGQALDSRVGALLATPEALWLATRTRLLRLRLPDRQLRPVLDGDGADLSGVQALCRLEDGTILVATLSGRLWRLPMPGAQQVVSAQAVALAADPPVGSLTSLDCRGSGPWLGSTVGVFRYDQSAQRLESLRFDEPALDRGARHVRAVLQDGNGQLWLGYWNDGLVRVDPATGAHRWFHPARPGAGALRATSVYALALGPDGAVYIASNRGLVVWRPDCDCIVGLNHPDWDKLDGAGVIIESVLVDPDDAAVWAGHFGGGLYRFAPEDAVFGHLVRVDGRDDGLATGMVRGIHLDGAGRLWLGSHGGGVQWVESADRRPGQQWPLQSLDWPIPRVESRYIWQIGASDDGGLMLSTGGGWYQVQQGQVSGFQPPVESGRTSLRLADGRWYVGGNFGLFRVESGDRLRAVPLGPKEPAVWSLSAQRDQLWVGTSDGLYRLAADDRVLAHHGVGLAAGQLPGAMVLAARRGADGRIWLPTSGGLIEAVWPEGLASPDFRPQPALIAKSVRNISSLEIDGSDALWLGTPRGLVRYRPETGLVELYDHRDGLVSNQLVSNGSARGGEHLYFGTVNGLIHFEPRALPPRTTRMQPRIARWRLGQGDWQLPTGERLELDHDHAPLQLELTALQFRWPDQVRYLYRWRNLGGEFIELGDARSAVFSDLPGGEHELELCAVLTQPFFAENRAVVLSVRVALAWQQTWWGRLLLVAVGLLGIWLLVAWRSRQARVQRRLLERLVAQRTQELERASTAMEAANARLRALANNDPLTGLANRRQLFEQAARWQREERRMAVIMVDIDHFKRINDQHGHEAGDAVLRAFAGIMGTIAGTPDSRHELCARYGGEEFVWLLAECDEARLQALAEELLRRTRQLRIVLDTDASLKPVLQVTASIGAACARPGESVEGVIRRADSALYRVKGNGRDGWLMG